MSALPPDWSRVYEETRTGHTPIHGFPPVQVPVPERPSVPVPEPKTPETPWGVKIGAAAAALLTLLGGAFVINVTVSPKGAEAQATSSTPSAAVVAAAPRVEVLSRAEIEQIATLASAKASERLAVELENRRRSERELMDAKLGRIDDKLDGVRETLQLILRSQRRR